VGPEVKHGLPEGCGPLNKGCERRTWALPDVSGGGERHDRFGVVVGEGVVEPRIEGRFARRVYAGMHAPRPTTTHGSPRLYARARPNLNFAPNFPRRRGTRYIPSDIELAGLSEEDFRIAYAALTKTQAELLKPNSAASRILLRSIVDFGKIGKQPQ
jgi:hypothetical protein